MPDSSKWSDDTFLDSLRILGDKKADECVSQLIAEGHESDFHMVFRKMNSNVEDLPEGLPSRLAAFFSSTSGLPESVDGAPVDMARLKRGGTAFLRHAFTGSSVLIAKSLPEGYAAPNLSIILQMSDNLSQRPFKRLLGVLQMVINLCQSDAFEEKGNAIVTAQKLRLLHAGVRFIAAHPEERLKGYPDGYPDLENFQKQYGVVVCLEDMLGTIMGFSWLMIEGLRTLDVGMTSEEEEDYYYLFRVFAQLMGIHPEGQPDSLEFIPSNLSEAKAFYDSYQRRHYVPAEENPEGVILAQANIDMMNRLLPQTPLRRLGLKIVPRILMQELCGKEGMVRVGVKPVLFLPVTKTMIRLLLVVWRKVWKQADKSKSLKKLHEKLSAIFFQKLINIERGGEVTFRIPQDLQDLRELAGEKTPGE